MGGVLALYTGYFRPNPAYPSQIVGVAWMNQDLVATHLVAGTAEPVPGTPPTVPRSPGRPPQLAGRGVQSGWKMRDSRGGFYADGKASVPLHDGARRSSSTAPAASRSGGGSDVGRVPHSRGRPAEPRPDRRQGGRCPGWRQRRRRLGRTRRTSSSTPGGPVWAPTATATSSTSPATSCPGRAGRRDGGGRVRRGMELDIHPKTVTFTTFAPAAGRPRPQPAKLLPAMLPSRPLPRPGPPGLRRRHGPCSVGSGPAANIGGFVNHARSGVVP